MLVESSRAAATTVVEEDVMIVMLYVLRWLMANKWQRQMKKKRTGDRQV